MEKWKIQKIQKCGLLPHIHLLDPVSSERLQHPLCLLAGRAGESVLAYNWKFLGGIEGDAHLESRFKHISEAHLARGYLKKRSEESQPMREGRST